MYTQADKKRRAEQLAQDRAAEDERKKKIQQSRPRDTRSKPFGAPYGNSSSYTPDSDYSPSYTPPPDYRAPDPAPASDYSGGGGSFDGGGSSGDW